MGLTCRVHGRQSGPVPSHSHPSPLQRKGAASETPWCPHAPLAPGTLPNHGDSEVFACDPYTAIETMANIAEHVNAITLDEARAQHKARARHVSRTSKRMHARQRKLHPLPAP